MESAKAAALQHVRVMEARIERQEGLIEHLESAGQDASDETQRLILLQRARDEMLLQLGQLLPRDTEGASINQAPTLAQKMLGNE